MSVGDFTEVHYLELIKLLLIHYVFNEWMSTQSKSENSNIIFHLPILLWFCTQPHHIIITGDFRRELQYFWVAWSLWTFKKEPSTTSETKTFNWRQSSRSTKDQFLDLTAERSDKSRCKCDRQHLTTSKYFFSIISFVL